MKDDPSDERHEDPGRDALRAERDRAGTRSRQPHVVGPRQLVGDFCARVAGTHHKDTPVLELTGLTVVSDMKLDDARIELAGERWDPG
jgi:hypothetical protein